MGCTISNLVTMDVNAYLIAREAAALIYWTSKMLQLASTTAVSYLQGKSAQAMVMAMAPPVARTQYLCVSPGVSMGAWSTTCMPDKTYTTRLSAQQHHGCQHLCSAASMQHCQKCTAVWQQAGNSLLTTVDAL